MDNWEALKKILEADVEAWGQVLDGLKARLTLLIDPNERHAAEMQSIAPSIYRASAEHYLDVVREIESSDNGEGTEIS